MTKIVINACYGGFGLSPKASELLNKKKNLKKGDKGYTDPEHGSLYHIPRHDKHLVQVVEELGEKANAQFADLVIVEAEGYQYRVEEYDGNESLKLQKQNSGKSLTHQKQGIDFLKHFYK